MSIPKHTLSKSTFMRGLQCHKSLYMHKYYAEYKDPLTQLQKAIFSRGTNVGELAQGLFPGGVDSSPETPYEYQKAVSYTKQLIDEGVEIIYEACFQYEKVLVALDILVKKNGKWNAYEVKSSTRVKDTHIRDASLQYHVIVKSGVPLESINLVHINTAYIKDGKLDIKKLFHIEKLTRQVISNQSLISDTIPLLKNMLTGKEIPNVNIGEHCNSPYTCDFKGHCWEKIPKNSVFNISGLHMVKAMELYMNGIIKMEDIPESHPLNRSQRMQVNAVKNDKTYTEHKKITEFIDTVNFPAYFFDFETLMPAVPVWDKTKPYQQLPFQYSIHYRIDREHETEHYEHLAIANGTDPRLALTKQLINDTKRPGDIWVYNISFERSRLMEMARDLPQYADELKKIVRRLRDLMIPFQQKLVYTAEMEGRHSIKKILPAMVPEMNYDDLEINEGGTASNTFEAMVSGSFNGDVEKTRTALLEYCKLDTYAMVKLLDKLFELAT